jgi:ELWxxDGT repeat protein
MKKIYIFSLLLFLFPFCSQAQCTELCTTCSPVSIKIVNGKMMYIGNSAANGREAWVSDGTSGGTHMIRDLNGTSADGAYVGNAGDWNGANSQYMFYFGDDGTNGVELWRTDGTDAGTVMVKDIRKGAGGSNGYFIAGKNTIGNSVIFLADDDGNGFDFWKTDGTSAGTVKLADMNIHVGAQYPYGLGNIGAYLIFAISDINGNKMWSTDGTAAGTQMLNASGMDDYSFFHFKNKLYYFAYHTGYAELWSTDGTIAGTSKQINLYPADMYWTGLPGAVTVDSDYFYFEAKPYTAGGHFTSELWRSDGTTAGTSKIIALNSYIVDIIAINHILYFTGYQDNNNQGLWRSNGTDTSTYLLKVMPDFPLDQHIPGFFAAYSDNAFFNYDNSLYMSDGSNPGTKQACNNGAAYQLTKYNGGLYYTNTGFWKYGAGSGIPGHDESDMDINIFPNPAHESIKVTGYPDHSNIEVENIYGQIVYSLKNMEYAVIEVNTINLTPGLYTLKITSGNRIYNKKFIKI